MVAIILFVMMHAYDCILLFYYHYYLLLNNKYNIIYIYINKSYSIYYITGTGGGSFSGSSLGVGVRKIHVA